MFEKNQNTMGPKTLWDSRLGVYFLTGDGSRCNSCGAFTKGSCDGMRPNIVFCSTRVLAHPSFTFTHPSANWRIFVFEYLLYFLYRMTEVRAVVSLAFFSLKKLEKTVSENCAMLM
jgi:hypothetical protein